MRLRRAQLAARLFALDPAGLGGLQLRGDTPLRERVLAELRTALGDRPLRRVPLHIDDERLLGGIDLAASLGAGRAVVRAGVLAEANGGAILLPMAERLDEGQAGRILSVLDRGRLILEREGASLDVPTRFGLVLLDDGLDASERPPDALSERCGLWLDCTLDEDMSGPIAPPLPVTAVAPPGDAELAALGAASLMLGVGSMRACALAMRAAIAHAALMGRSAVTADDVSAAVTLVLAPRATQWPTDAPPPDQLPEPPEPALDPGENQTNSVENPSDRELLLEAARTALPADLLRSLAEGQGRGLPPRSRGAGEDRETGARGRPAGTRPGLPRSGQRLALIATLRMAAPWQKLRGRVPSGPIKVRRDDLRVKRYRAPAAATTIFLVDASGSAAFARLAEAKGAVELMLGQAHVTRSEVALAAFRGTGADLLLPPTRSLTRARRALAEMPGGGGTPLAAGLELGRVVASAVKAKGRTPTLVVLTDGRANVGGDGVAGRLKATDDANVAARQLAQMGVSALVIDISVRPQPEAAALAKLLKARYLGLPRADAATLAAVISQ